MTWLLSGLTLLFVIVWQAPAFYTVRGLAGYLPLHMFAETFSIVISMLVFGVAWNVYSKERPANIVILACALLAVSLIDFAHMLSFKGMPDFITPSGPEKAINLWLSARLVAALALLVVGMRSWRQSFSDRARNGLLAGSLAVSAVVIWLELAYPQAWPRTFIEGQGLTPFKIGAEYVIIAILLVPAVLFYAQARRPQSYDASGLFAATVITILSELSFTVYSDVADIFNLLGHLYKIAAYAFIYRAVFVSSVREPFLRLDAELAENRRISDELRAASLYTRSLIEASLDPLVTISAEGKITDVNKATESATGRGRSELVGTDFSNCFAEPDKAREAYRKAFLDGFVADYPLVLRHRDGHLADMLYNASVYRDEQGEVLGVFASARDITDRKRIEQALRDSRQRLDNIVANSPGAIYRCAKDPEWTMEFLSAAITRITGYPAEDFLNNRIRSYASIIHPDDRRRVEEAVTTGVGSGEHYEMDYRLIAADGTTRWVHEQGRGVFDADEGLLCLDGVILDITDQRRAEAEIRTLNQRLEQRVSERTAQLENANKELEAFSYSVSHDLRSPLRAIDGFSNILLEDYSDKLDDEGRRLLGVVRDNTKRMGQLIDDILKFSRAGRLEINLSAIDMAQVAHSVLAELQPAVEGGKLQVEIGQLPQAMGDAAMIRQVFVNLFSNAIKFSRTRESPKIVVGAADKGGETVYFVKDNGVGFNMEYADKLFGVFQRLHGVNEFEGTGIGLAIVKRIIMRHGGRVWAEGKVGEGATFYFSIPSHGIASDTAKKDRS